MYELHLSVVGHADSDDLERAQLGRDLGAALAAHRVGEVSHARGDAPPGAKGSALEWAQLVVGFSGSLPALIGFVRSWQSGGKARGAAIAVEVDGDRLVLENPADAERERLISAWLERREPRG